MSREANSQVSLVHRSRPAKHRKAQLKGAYVFKALSDVIRIGVAAFVINHGKSEEGSEADGEDKPITMPEGELDLNDVLYVSGAESWGPVTREDPKVWVTIV
jgi:hypothetical protein